MIGKKKVYSYKTRTNDTNNLKPNDDDIVLIVLFIVRLHTE